MNKEVKQKFGIKYELVSMAGSVPKLNIYHLTWKLFMVTILSDGEIYSITFELDEFTDVLMNLLTDEEKGKFLSRNLNFKTFEEAEKFVLTLFNKFKQYINT